MRNMLYIVRVLNASSLKSCTHHRMYARYESITHKSVVENSQQHEVDNVDAR